MRRLHRRAGLVTTLAAAMIIVSVLQVQAITPIDTTSSAGIHMLTVPQIQLPGYGVGTAVDIADNGWVALTNGLWEGEGYPVFEVGPIPIPSNPQFTVTAIGADGTVAGNYLRGSGSARWGFVRHPDGTMEDLVPPGYAGSNPITPTGISDEGYIVGTFQSFGDTCGPTISGVCSFLATPQAGGDYTIEILPATPNGTSTGGRFFALSVGGLTSTTGIIVGGSGWTWTASGGYVALDGGIGAAAYDVNSQGAVAGYYIVVSGITQAAYWSDRTATPVAIPRLGADTMNFAWAMNDADQVVGWSGTSSSPSVPRRAFLWDPTSGSMALGELPGGSSSEAKGITEDGLVVGQADYSQVIWDLDDDYDIDYPPDLTSLAATSTVIEGNIASYQFAIDDAEDDPFTVTFEDVPTGAVWEPTTGILEWQTGQGDAGTYPFTMTVEQQGKPVNAFTLSVQFTVVELLVMAPVGDRGVTFGHELQFTPDLTGADSPAFYAYGGTPDALGALPAGASINRTNGLFTWTPTIDQVGDHVITIIANQRQFSPVAQEVSATFTISVYEPVQIDIAESVTVTDVVAVRLPVLISISEPVAVSDTVAVRPPVLISISESVAVSDTVAVRPPVLISITESVSVTDAVAVRPPVVISISEAVGVADTVGVTPGPGPEVSGRVWVDFDADGTSDTSEPGLAGVTVYIDLDRNSTKDAGEPTAVTSATGTYAIVDVPPGTFDVRAVLPAGYATKFPSGAHTVTASYGDEVTGIDFGADPNGVDTDGDDIADSIDGVIDLPGFVTMRAVFSDGFTDQHRNGGMTHGVVLDRVGTDMTVSDAADVTDGVIVVVADEVIETFADLKFCGRPEVVGVRDGSTATFTCGSLLVEVADGLVRIETSDGASVQVPSSSTVLIDDTPGDVTVEAVVGDAQILANGVVTELSEGQVVKNPGGPAPGSELDLAASFVPVSPIRLFDTRPGEPGDGPKGKLAALTTIDVQVGGKVGVPLDAVAVVMNVTVTEPDGPGFVTVHPTGTARPLASSVNISQAGQTRPNLVTVLLGDDGKVSLYSWSGAHLLADVAGYYVDADVAVAAGRFVPLTPQRLFDTRPGEPAPGHKGRLGAEDTIDVQVLGVGDVPDSGVSAIVVNITATEAGAPGFVTGYPTGEERPLASNVNLDQPGATAPNLAIIPIGAGGMVSLYSDAPVHLLGDVTGYITDGSVPAGTEGLFVPLEPTRVFDTREVETPPGPKGFVAADQAIDVDVGGAAGVPADAAGVVLNVTGIDSPPGFLTAWQRGPERPLASTLNFATPLDTRANAAMLPIGVDGQISFYTQNGSDILADVSGYFLGERATDGRRVEWPSPVRPGGVAGRGWRS
jgi:hypothetical protein